MQAPQGMHAPQPPHCSTQAPPNSMQAPQGSMQAPQGGGMGMQAPQGMQAPPSSMQAPRGNMQAMQAGIPLGAQPPSMLGHSPPRMPHAAAGAGHLGAAAPSPARTSSENHFNVGGLSSYKGNNWHLLARVTKKNNKRKFGGRGREGQLFSVTLTDNEGAETRGTFFNAAADKFFGLLEEGQVYVFSGGKVKQADKRYTSGIDIEITFDEKAAISPEADNGEIPQLGGVIEPLESLASIQSQEKDAQVDIVAIIAEADPPTEYIKKKDGQPGVRQDCTLLDDTGTSGTSCKLTFWESQPDLQAGSVIVMKQARVGDFGGRSLSCSFSTTVLHGDQALGIPSIRPRAEQLSRWYREQGATALVSARQLTEGRRPAVLQTIEEMKADARDLEAPGADPGAEGRGDGSRQIQKYHTLSPVTVTFIPHEKPPFYMACAEEVPDDKKEGQTRACNKKLEPGDNCWTCAAGHCCQEPSVRWICQFSVSDHTGTQYMSSFDDVGQVIMGCKAEEVGRRWDRREEDSVQRELDRLFNAGLHKRWRIRVKSRKEFWNDEEKLKFTAMEMTPIDLVQDGKLKFQEVFQSLAAMESR